MELKIDEIIKYHKGNYVKGTAPAFPINMVISVENNLIKTEPLENVNWQSLEPLFDDSTSVIPLPLNDAWFLRFGFHMIEAKGKTITYGLNDLRFEVMKNGSTVVLAVRDKFPVDVFIKNVHELQNYYRQIIGEELTIK